MTIINKIDLQVLEQLQQWENSIVCGFMQVFYLDWSYLDQKNMLMEVRENLASGDGGTPAGGDGVYVAEACSSKSLSYFWYGATILSGWLGNSTRIAIDSIKQKLTMTTTALHQS